MQCKKLVCIVLFVTGIIVFSTHASDQEPGSVQGFSDTQDRGGHTENMVASVQDQEPGYPYRGLLIGADHGTGDIHHDNIYFSIDNGLVMYQTTIPARKAGNLLPDAGLLWHFFTRDNTDIAVYATSAWQDGTESALSAPFPLFFSYPQPHTCTEQTVPVAMAGEDQLVSIGELVTLDASLSYDAHTPDNNDLTYIWECYSAPESSVVLSDEGKVAVTTFTPNVQGNYYFRLTLRDNVDGSTFNRSPVAYVKVAVVEDKDSLPYISANAGRTRQVQVGEVVVLDAGQSSCSSPITSFSWRHENPLDNGDMVNISNDIGMISCQGSCYLSNFDADADVDGMDLAIIAANYSRIELPDQEQVQFVAGIARPHIFRLTVSDGTQTDSETVIIAVNHENAALVLTHPDVEATCVQ